MTSQNPKGLSQLDPGGVLKNIHDYDIDSIRTVDGKTEVPSDYTKVVLTYNNLNSVSKAVFSKGTTIEITEIETIADIAGSLNDKYFYINSAEDDELFYVWLNVDSSGTDPAISGRIGIEVPLTSGDSSNNVAAAVKIYVGNQRNFTTSRSNDKVKVENIKLGETTNSSDINTGFSISIEQEGETDIIKTVTPHDSDNIIYSFNEVDKRFEIENDRYNKIFPLIESSGFLSGETFDKVEAVVVSSIITDLNFYDGLILQFFIRITYNNLKDFNFIKHLAVTDIILSDETIIDGSIAGTVVGTLSTTGGTAPITYTITSDPSDKFDISGSDLVLDNTVDIADVSYGVTIKATDNFGLEFSEAFTITVVPLNQFSTITNGINEYVSILNPSNFHFESGGSDQACSFSGWAKMVDATNFILFAKGAVANREYTFRCTGTDNMSFQLYGTAAGTVRIGQIGTGTETASQGSWVNYVATYNGNGGPGGITLYKLGAVLASGSSTAGVYSSVRDSGDKLEIARWDGFDHSDGKLDEMSVWDKELSLAEVQEIYNSGSPTDLKQHSAAANLVSWWRMGDLTDDLTGGTGTIFDREGSNDGTPFNTTNVDNKSTDVPT